MRAHGLCGLVALACAESPPPEATQTSPPSANATPPSEGPVPTQPGPSEAKPETVPAAPSSAHQGITEPPRHALIIIIDTLRNDAVDRALTPSLDALRDQGIRAPVAWASGTWTVPSVVSILTGASVWEHGWNEPSARMGSYPPLPDLPRLPEVLQSAGFRTDGLYSNPYLAEELGFSRGFDTWKRSSDKSMLKQFKKLVEQTWGDGQRHFAYLHLLGPHSPVDPSPEAQARRDFDPSHLDSKGAIGIGRAKRNREEGIREAYRQGYLGTLEDTDKRVGELLDTLGPHRSETMVVLTSDHGELLGEHDIVGHGTWVWRELVEVPLFFDLPGDQEQLPSTVAIHAIPDLITQHLGIQADWPQRLEEGAVLISQREEFLAWSLDGRIKAIASDRGVATYDLGADPEELKPIEARSGLGVTLQEWIAAHPSGTSAAGEPVSLPQSTLDELEALGYLE